MSAGCVMEAHCLTSLMNLLSRSSVLSVYLQSLTPAIPPRLPQTSARSIPAPRPYSRGQITASHLSVPATTSAEVCVLKPVLKGPSIVCVTLYRWRGNSRPVQGSSHANIVQHYHTLPKYFHFVPLHSRGKYVTFLLQ